MPHMEGHLADRSYVSHLSQDHCEPAEGGHDPRMYGHHRWCRQVTWKMKIGDLEMFGSKTVESWWLRYHIRHLPWRYTPRFLYEVITWYRHVLPKYLGHQKTCWLPIAPNKSRGVLPCSLFLQQVVSRARKFCQSADWVFVCLLHEVTSGIHQEGVE